MSFDSFFFAVRSAVRNIFRNAVLSLASISVLTVCLVFFGSMMLVIQNVNAFLDSVGSENEIVIYLDENVTDEQIESVRAELEEIRNITDIRYESREQALENYITSIGNPSLTEGLDASVFRPSFIFELRDLTKFDQTMYELEKIEEIGKFSSGENAGKPAIRSPYEVVTKLISIREVLKALTVCIMLIFLITAVFIITNSVKLSVFARKDEIHIMKYVGATDFYIQLPYFIEGMLVGLFSGVLSYFIQIGVYQAVLVPILQDLELFSPVLLQDGIGYLFWIFVGCGLVVGALGSVFPVKKYLNV